MPKRRKATSVSDSAERPPNKLCCSGCVNLGAPIETRDPQRPVGYCHAFMMWRLYAETVPGCDRAKKRPLDAPSQRPSTG